MCYFNSTASFSLISRYRILNLKKRKKEIVVSYGRKLKEYAFKIKRILLCDAKNVIKFSFIKSGVVSPLK